MSPKYIATTFLVAIALNAAGALIQAQFFPPLFLDSIGTMFAAILIGPWFGALAGLTINLLKGIFYTTLAIPFGAVNFFIGLATGYLVIFIKGYHRWYAPLLIGAAAALLAPLVAAPIATYLFGGITAHGIDKFVVALVDGGNSILSSAFFGRLPYSFVDKLISAYVVFMLIKLIPSLTRQQSGSRQE